jgi:hypothetical protein
MSQPSPMITDEQLSAEGLELRNHGQVLLIACGALAREILALTKANGWTHMDLQCLPAIFHNEPEKITPAVKAMIERSRAKYAEIFVVYADCGTGGQLQRLCDAIAFLRAMRVLRPGKNSPAFISLIF